MKKAAAPVAESGARSTPEDLVSSRGESTKPKPDTRGAQPDITTRSAGWLAGALPVLPPPVFEVNRLLQSLPVDLKKVSRAIRKDSGLAAQVLGMCNSALGTAGERLLDIEQAVVLLGIERLRALVLTCYLLAHAEEQLPPSASKWFWQHSFLAGALSREVARFLGLALSEVAYVGALLHDMGHLPLIALAGHRPPAKFFDMHEEDLEQERTRFGLDHCEIGRIMALQWDFPLELVDVIEHHHAPELAANVELVRVVAAADRVAAAHGRDEGRSLRGARKPPSLTASALAGCLPQLEPERLLGLAMVLEDNVRDFFRRASGSWRLFLA